ncbi:uncharacterized protein B0I36DRAFT_340005 [Microdochium trichocladiopsis]|uniref:eIF3 subunit M C-terminal helix domain-containing protein n=1 Tax=Microdochium trichocladiopsis TaxID=1682393 RepID=A0A9P9BI30_9PEZI|nr:uncharacterized protein B0I36DRAFT_343040 [Microdochium trichocladiopsis]XP_046004917.1 uncharacterized protein B0I36DRAFT_340005 [Microdochium trichocladiopsis]KAH7007928.1 hypothetical protein B0I36DRAFT_343040 [Microdochium trichocladiopsis]KAH7012652.1 hypothetical protein B0I36DRAFT_340005 [Microdochium trichocladiopsis]
MADVREACYGIYLRNWLSMPVVEAIRVTIEEKVAIWVVGLTAILKSGAWHGYQWQELSTRLDSWRVTLTSILVGACVSLSIALVLQERKTKIPLLGRRCVGAKIYVHCRLQY